MPQGSLSYPPRDVPRAGRDFRALVVGDLAGLADDVGTLLEGQDGGAAHAFAGMVVTRRVVLNLKSGSALAGIVVRHDGPLLEVAEVTLLAPGAEPRQVDGRVVVERVEVEFVQVLT